jgi:hypothetical protein
MGSMTERKLPHSEGRAGPASETWSHFPHKLPVGAYLTILWSWLLCWEIYLIVLVAVFLRFYQFNTSEFDADMASLFQMARYAVTHGLIPATATTASIGGYNPPAAVDLFMLPALFTNDPVWGAISFDYLLPFPAMGNLEPSL